MLPHLAVAAAVQPITRGILRMTLTLTADFEWSDRYHGAFAEPFYVWVEDGESEFVYHSEQVPEPFSDHELGPYLFRFPI